MKGDGDRFLSVSIGGLVASASASALRGLVWFPRLSWFGSVIVLCVLHLFNSSSWLQSY
jgi:hypothetical protein